MPEASKTNIGKNDNEAPNWSRMHLWQMQPIRDVLLGLGIFALIIIGQKTSVVTVPLLLAILLAYLFEPVIVWLMKKFGASRRVSVIAIMVAVITCVVLPIMAGGAYAAGQLFTFTTDTIANVDRVNEALKQPDEAAARARLEGEGDAEPVPGAFLWVYDEIRQSESNDDSSMGRALDAAIDWIATNQEQIAKTTASVSVDLMNRILGILGAAFGIAFMVFVTAFFFFFTATEWIQLKQFGTKLLPDKNRGRIIDLLVKFDAVISGFIRGRITIAFIQGIVFSIGYFLIGVPGAFILGPVVAILSIVPYLALIGLPISVSLLALQGHDGFRGEWWWIVGAPTGIYFLGQALDDYVWTPIIQGKSTGMDTPTILFASLAGGALFGVFGLLIAIPIAACVKILIQEIFWPRFKEWAEGRADDPLPIE
ncbi:MAG: AI-2E family transporter [Phycisphaerales bacterium]